MPKPPAFDACAERASIAEALLGSAARLISGRSEREIVQGVCNALTDITPHIRLAWTCSGVFVLYADVENYFNEVGTGLFSCLVQLGPHSLLGAGGK